MTNNLLEYAFPIILFFVIIEMLFSYFGKRNYYHTSTLIGDVSTGIIFAIVGVGILAGALWIYAAIEKSFSLSAIGIQLFTVENPFWENGWTFKAIPFFSWFIAILLVDLFYYWFHRLAHEINILWACHITHHSSEEMNLAVSFRGNVFQRIFEYAFFLPLAIIGMPWFMFLLSHRLLKFYQFIVHTRYIGRLGFIEDYLVTPSNHRVHHGTEPEYIDKNHGGIFIIWDRMFGSYIPEGKEPLYGITVPVKTFNPIKNNIHHYQNIWADMKQVKGIGDKLRILYKHPGWKPEYLRGDTYGKIPTPAYTEIYNPPISRARSFYSVIQAILIIVLGVVTWKLAKQTDVALWFVIALTSFIIFQLVSINGILDSHNWAHSTEYLRNIILIALSAFFLYGTNLPEKRILPQLLPILMATSILSIFWFFILNRKKATDKSKIMAAGGMS